MSFERTGASEPRTLRREGPQNSDEGRAVDPEKRLSTAATSLADLLSDPASRVLIDRHFPGVSDDKRIEMAKGMTLRTIQAFAPDQFTDASLDALDADLARL